MPNQIAALLNTIDADKATLDAARPLPPHTVASLREKLMLKWTYHSNAIEGNTLTLRETKVVLEGIKSGGKSLREHFEATNDRDAILYVEDIVSKAEALSNLPTGFPLKIAASAQILHSDRDKSRGGRLGGEQIFLAHYHTRSI
jgi:Fic family protein